MASATNFISLTHLPPSFSQTPVSRALRKPSSLTPVSSFHSPHSPTQTLTIQGGSKLHGHVNISGSKNSALAILAATLSCSGTSTLHNIPNVSDIRTMFSVLQSLGVKVDVNGGDVMVNTDRLCSIEPCAEAVEKIRGGFFVAGPLLARFGEAVVALPGGCDIGARPIDLYVRGFRALGAVVELRHGKLYATAANGKGLVGGNFCLDFPSVGATETLMMAASMADGVTILSNIAQEPEVVDLAQFLINSGASIEGVGTTTLVINGRKRLYPPEYTIIPDRIEAGTFMIAAAITGSCFSLSPVIPSHLLSLTEKLLLAGCKITKVSPKMIYIASTERLRGFDIKTGPFPEFPTDLQPQVTTLLTMSKGKSIVEELVFERRMDHIKELQRLGARVRVYGSTAVIYGEGEGLRGGRVLAKDLRGGAALVLAGLGAEGVTEVEGMRHIERGYENFEMKLCELGATIRRKSGTLPAKL